MGNEIKVGLTLTDFDCAPEEITQKIGIEPTVTWLAGEPILGGTRSYKENGWRLEVRDEDASGVDDLAKQLLQRLEGSRYEVAKLAAEFYAEISCIVYATEFVPELHFDRETLERIARLGAGIDIDLYCLTSDTDHRT